MDDAVEIANSFAERLLAAWNDGDSAAYANLFAVDAICLTCLGDVARGRLEIESNHELVRVRQGKSMSLKVQNARFHSEETCAVFVAIGLGAEAPVPFFKSQILLLTRWRKSWICSAMMNFAMSEAEMTIFRGVAA